MKKMIAIYRAPEDADAFMAHYRDVHMPLVRKLPGLIDTRITRITRNLVGETDSFLVAEMSFADEGTLKSALKSPENAAVGADAMRFAGDLLTVTLGESIDF